MSASLETNNYHLPIYTNQDTIAYIPDWNKAMREIDSQMNTNSTATGGAVSDVENLTKLVTALSTEVNSLTNIQNKLIQKHLPVVTISPGGWGTQYFGYYNDYSVLISGTIYTPANYLEKGLIHFNYGNYEVCQMFSMEGNPFNISETPSNARRVGSSYYTIFHDAQPITTDIKAAVENNITYFYIQIPTAHIDKEFSATYIVSFKKN